MKLNIWSKGIKKLGVRDKIRLRTFSKFIAMYIPLLILYKALGSVFVKEVEGINFMMTMLTIPSCLVYYSITKKDNYICYMLFFISLLYDNTYTHIRAFYGEVDRLVPLVLIFRNLIFIIIAFDVKPIIKWTSKHSWVSFILLTVIDGILLFTNEKVAYKIYAFKYFNQLFVIWLVIMTFLVIIIFIKAVRTKEFVELIFLSSICTLSIRRISIFFKTYTNFDGIIFLNEKWLFCFALYIVPIALFVEYYSIIKDKTKLEAQVENISRDMEEFHEIDKLRTQFFANLSHEIKTPINIIFSGLQLIESKRKFGDEILLEYYNKYTPMIKQNCFRILRLTNNLVDMTKLDSGFMKMKFRDVDIVKTVEDITMSVVKYVENKNINIVFDTMIEEKYIRCDKDGMERIMLNLISNSIKFTKEEGNILVYIDEEDGYVVIRVKDDGIGIPVESREKVFNVFEQEDKSLNREREGSGIGLSLVKAIVEKHEGTVYFEDVEEGTEVVVKIPDRLLDNSESHDNHKIEYSTDIIEKINIEFSDIYD